MVEISEIRISNSPDLKTFKDLADFISSTYSGKLIAQVDGVDQSYWDFEIGGRRLTLHLEHYLGISLFSTDNSTSPPLPYRNLIEIRTRYFGATPSQIAFKIPTNQLEVVFWKSLWGFMQDDQFYSFSEVSDCLPAVPLLETERDNVDELICSASRKIGITSTDFPLRNIVLKALGETEYYFNLGVTWIEAGFPCDPCIIDKIEDRTKDKSLSQRTRHQSLALLENLRKVSG